LDSISFAKVNILSAYACGTATTIRVSANVDLNRNAAVNAVSILEKKVSGFPFINYSLVYFSYTSTLSY